MKDKKPKLPVPPVQSKDYDLSGCRNGVAKPKDAPPGLLMKASERSPSGLMRAMGFEPSETMTPLQFLVAVMNDQLDLIYKDEDKRKRTKDKGGIGISYRIECAKTAANYIHMEMPKVTLTDTDDENFSVKLQKAMSLGNARISRKRVIIETIEQTGPDTPIPQASYPPAFEAIAKQKLPNGITPYDVDDTKNLNPEGDTEYDPDADTPPGARH